MGGVWNWHGLSAVCQSKLQPVRIIPDMNNAVLGDWWKSFGGESMTSTPQCSAAVLRVLLDGAHQYN